MKQATDVAGTGAKALNFTRVDSKVGVQTGIGAFTTNTQAAGNTYTDLVSAEAQGLFAIEFKADTWTSTTASTACRSRCPTPAPPAPSCCALYILRGARYATGARP
jgi:predicted lipoprotein with Yx(FWY)xxD motif